MKIWEFVKELAFYFPLNANDEAKNKIFDSYVENLEGIMLANKCDYDWKKVLSKVQCSYTYSKFPPLADIIKVLPECKVIKPYQACVGEGSLIVITLPNGTIYSFTVSGMGKSLEYYKEDIEKKYGACKIETYPKKSVLIGTKVFEG